ncbi:MAG: hypothetical protein AAF589_07855 [Planctomycetota bacterium]
MPRSVACLALFVAAALFAGRSADAQFVTYYSPVVAAPAPIVTYRPVTPTVVYRPVVAAPAPVAVTVARPVVTTTLAPVAYTRTRWRPLLGGTVTRVRYGYAPVRYYSY